MVCSLLDLQLGILNVSLVFYAMWFSKKIQALPGHITLHIIYTFMPRFKISKELLVHHFCS